MMPQREAGDSIHEKSDPTYGGYEGSQMYSDQHYDASYEQPLRSGAAGKVYPAPSDNKNVLRLLTFVVAMVFLVIFAIICLLAFGGTGGWISFSVAAFVIFVTAVVAIDKIK
jgi:hypothetical protein